MTSNRSKITMANSPRRVKKFGNRIFEIVKPDIHERICIRESDGTIHIVFNGDTRERYVAYVKNFAAGSGEGTVISSGDLVETPIGSAQYLLDLSVGAVAANPPLGTDNRFIRVTDPNTGNSDGHPFAAIHCPIGSGSNRLGVAAARGCENCDPQRPVPVALILQVGKTIEAGACDQCARLGEPTLLTHSDDAKHPCSWFSQPIDFCSGKGSAGIWMLQKADAYTWALTLRRNDLVAVTYSATTKSEKECSFPLELELLGKAGAECKKWPKSVRVVPAP
jgi:hypothetical protein